MFESADDYILQRKLKRETEIARNTEAALTRALDGVYDRVNSFFNNSRRLKGDDLKQMFTEIDASVKGDMTAVRQRFDERPATRARPKSEAYEAMYVLVNNQEADSEYRDMVFRLLSMRIFGSRKRVTIDIRPLPASFSRHSAARLHERGMEVDQGVSSIGSFVQDWCLLPILAADSMMGIGASRFSVPGPSDGLLLGYIDPTAAVPMGVRFNYDIRGGFREWIPADPLEPALYSAHTYVGEADLTEYQADLRRCFDVWREACGDSYATALDDLLWPDREILPATGVGLSDQLSSALEALVTDTRSLAAMGNHRFVKGNIGLHGALLDYPDEESPEYGGGEEPQDDAFPDEMEAFFPAP